MWQFIANTLRDATPIMLAAMAGVLAFRAGIFHVGLEGLVCFSAFAALAVTKETNHVIFGLLAAVASSVLLSLLYWWVIDRLHANVIISGLGLASLGVAGSSYLLQVCYHTQGAIQTNSGLYQPVKAGHLSGVLGALNGLSILTWLLPIIVFTVWIAVRRSTTGLRLTVVGEYPFAARSAGISLPKTRLMALLIGGVLCGLAGCELSMGNLNSFTPDMTNGLGYIAFTAVVFGAASPIGTALASISFGITNAIGIQAQLQRWDVPIELVQMLPYVLTLIVVAIAGAAKRGSVSAQPEYAQLSG
jgi:ABC-type uncharacterized transport system permease subunit